MIKNVEEQQVFIRRVSEAAAFCRQKQIPKHIGFLTEGERILAFSALNHEHSVGFSFWGGYGDAARTFLSVYPDFMEEYEVVPPLRALSFAFSGNQLAHRDVLGSLMALGIKREAVGDILLQGSNCIFFVTDTISCFVMGNLCKIGNLNVSCREYEGPVDYEQQFETIKGTVASMRLDCVVALLGPMGREQSAQMITAGRIFLNDMQCLNQSKLLDEGDIVVIRGSGKFRVDQIGGRTRKNRIGLVIKKYT